jgi:electron transport complex protein RnfG
MKKDFLIPILVLVVICVVVSGALAATNGLTEPMIVAAAGERASAAMRELIPEAADFELLEDARFPDGVVEAYRAVTAEGDRGYVPPPLGYIFTLSADGYGGSGSLRLMAAVSPDGVILAMKTLANGETKGLGSRTSESAYEGQFVGMDANLTGYQAITGATISSKAYRGAVEKALAAFELVQGGAQ